MIVGNDPILLTPGPLTTSLATKQAMLRDWGSWDAAFNAITASLRRDLVDIVRGGDEYTCVPLQGSGTFSVEAAIGTLVPRDGKVLVPNNGAYCARIVRICKYLGRAVVDLAVPEDQPATAADDRRGACRRSDDHARGPGPLRDRRRDPERSRRHRAGLRATRQGPDRRCDELVRRAADRCAHDAVRRADRGQRQVPRGRARHGLRHRAQGRAGGARGQRPLAGDGPARPVRLHGEDHPVALHAADPRGGCAARGGRPVRGRRRAAGAPGALHAQLRNADRRHGRARLSSVPEARGAGADHRHLPCAGGPGLRLQDVLCEDARPRLHPVSRAS